MKKLLSLFLAILMCLPILSTAVFAEDASARKIATVELHTVKYYEAVRKESDISSAAIYVNFLVYYTDGSSATFDSKNGWDDPTVTDDVSWHISSEYDENYGSQQSLYVTIGGTDYWAGYVNVEVNAFKAIMRNIITWDWMTCEEKVEASHELFRLLKFLFATLRDELGGTDAYDYLYRFFDAFDNIIYTMFPSKS